MAGFLLELVAGFVGIRTPALRRLDSGAVIEVDAILRVLVSLDELAPSQRDRK